MKLPSLSTTVFVLFLLYIGNVFYLIWVLVQPPVCTNKSLCLKSFLLRKPNLELNIFFSLQINPQRSEVFYVKNFLLPDYNVSFKRMMTVEIPIQTKQNGTLYAHVFLSEAQEILNSEDKWTKLQKDPMTVLSVVPMSVYKEPDYKSYRLIKDEKNVIKVKKAMTHVKTVLPVSMLTEPLNISETHIPDDIHQYIRLYKKNQEYLPIFLYNCLQDRSYNTTKVDKNTLHLPILLHYKPLSYAGLRILTQTELTMVTMQKFGFKNKDIDRFKAIFDINHYLLLVLIFVAIFQILLHFLAIKNDILFWKSRKSMAGLSPRYVVWCSFSQIIVLLYLFNEKASLLLIVPSIIKFIIEIWKLFKIIPVDWKNFKFKQLNLNRAEKDTKKFDAESMNYLLFILYPLCLGSVIYLLIYEPQKSWYSHIFTSLVNGIYIFGFLFMLPQFFINYKLKSVEHLPWKTLMYKAFNTFIDDLYAFILPMPTAHRLACFRDDIVFLIYMYQRWWYPVDLSRLHGDIEESGPFLDQEKTKTE